MKRAGRLTSKTVKTPTMTFVTPFISMLFRAQDLSSLDNGMSPRYFVNVNRVITNCCCFTFRVSGQIVDQVIAASRISQGALRMLLKKNA
jgi:hypothetical protein